MKTKDQMLLEDAYDISITRQVLLQQGYSAAEISNLEESSKIWDSIKNKAKTAGLVGATVAAGALGAGGHSSGASGLTKNAIRANRGAAVQYAVDTQISPKKIQQGKEILDSYTNGKMSAEEAVKAILSLKL